NDQYLQRSVPRTTGNHSEPHHGGQPGDLGYPGADHHHAKSINRANVGGGRVAFAVAIASHLHDATLRGSACNRPERQLIRFATLSPLGRLQKPNSFSNPTATTWKRPGTQLPPTTHGSRSPRKCATFLSGPARRHSPPARTPSAS